MADRSKFEEMLELLVNEDKEGAEALFHEIVVEKSRDIYESLLEDEAEVDESDDDVEEATDEEVDESDEDLDEATDEEVDESDEEVEEDFDLDEFEVEADPMAAMGGDAGDDMEMDIDMGDDDEGDMDDEGEDGPEAAMDNLEDALDALKAEFEKMMAGDEGGEDDDDEEPEEESFAFESDDDEVDEAADEEVDESDEDLEEGKMKDKLIGDSEKMTKAEFAKKHGKEAADEHYESAKSAGEQMREYVEKVSGGGLDAQGSAPMGDNGANTKSPVAGKNDMGGTASNLNQGKDNEAGDHGGFAGLNAKEDNAGNRNKPGGMSAKKGMKNEPGHGAEKKGKAPEKAGSDSPINGVSSRAK